MLHTGKDRRSYVAGMADACKICESIPYNKRGQGQGLNGAGQKSVWPRQRDPMELRGTKLLDDGRLAARVSIGAEEVHQEHCCRKRQACCSLQKVIFDIYILLVIVIDSLETFTVVG